MQVEEIRLKHTLFKINTIEVYKKKIEIYT